MKLESILIKGFRSITEASLPDCGGFNVIIGKNNAGKSNILLAINAFFACLKKGGVVTLDPPVGRQIDRFGGGDQPIEFGMVFGLSLAERDNLIQDIVSESPQVKNAVDGMDPNLRLGVLLVITSDAEPFAYVKEMLLCDNAATAFSSAVGFSRTILEIGDQAAFELARRASLARQREREAVALKDSAALLERRISDEDWLRLRSDPVTLRRMRLLTPIAAEQPLSRALQSRMEDLIKSSESPTAYQEAIGVLSNALISEAQEARSEALKNRVESFAGQEDAIPGYARKLLEAIGSMKVLYLTERRELIGKKEAAQLLELKVKRGGPEKLRSIQETVSALLGVEIDAFQAEGRMGGEPAAELDVDRFLVQVNGAGIREALRLIMDFEFGRPNILLVEEPEIHLHPALETSMMRYLKRAGEESQIFVTTHSTNFLDTAEMRNVYLASKDKSTRVQVMSFSEAEDYIPRELGIRLSSLFMYDRLVFVEGPSDEDVLREWAATLGVNFSNASVGFVPMGGVRNLAHYATGSTISFLTKRQVRMWFLFDRDERDEVEIRNLVRQLGTRARMHVLARREIENYLLCRRALVRFIVMKQQMMGLRDHSEVTESNIESVLSECSDQLMETALDYRVVKEACRPLYPDREALLSTEDNRPLQERITADLERQREQLLEIENKIGELIASHQKKISEAWGARKLEIVPGDLLLDRMCKKFGVRFHKDRDSQRLAALMSTEEIASEIRELLQEIVAT